MNSKTNSNSLNNSNHGENSNNKSNNNSLYSPRPSLGDSNTPRDGRNPITGQVNKLIRFLNC